jgi:hypothetical protein
VDKCGRFHGESCAKIIKDISFSNDLINEGVLMLLDDIIDQLIDVICSSNGSVDRCIKTCHFTGV